MVSTSSTSRPPNPRASSSTRHWEAPEEHNRPLSGLNQRDESSGRPTPRKAPGQLTSLPGGNKAIGAFILSLVAFTVQTEFAQYVQQTLNYRKPVLSLWLGHSGFMALFPMHLLYLHFSSPEPLSHHLHRISQNLHWQISTPSNALPLPVPDSIRRRLSSASGRGVESQFDAEVESASRRRSRGPVYSNSIEQRFGFNAVKLFGLLAILTLGITVPALSWYCAVPLTSMSDITSIYNTFSVWALVFSVIFLGEKWEKRKVISVLLACLGVFIVAYGGAEHRKKPKETDPIYGHPPSNNATISAISTLEKEEPSFSNPILGDLLAFIGAVTMAAYEMAFKVVGTLPDEAKQAERYDVVNASRRRSRTFSRGGDDDYRSLPNEDDRETTGLLGEDGESGGKKDDETLNESNGHHVIGDDAEDGESQAIWSRKTSHDEPLSYQSISPPDQDQDQSKTTASPLDEFKSNGDIVKPKKQVRLGAPSLIGPEEENISETESEISEAEEDVIERGLTRLSSTRSFNSIGKKYGKGVVEARDSSKEGEEGEEEDDPSQTASSTRRRERSTSIRDDGSWIPPPLPFGLHANIMTSGIGFVTFTCLWIGIPIVSLLGLEPFELPTNLWTYFCIFLVVAAGIFFNGAFMILLSLWGPVLASVSCLMTTLLVVVADTFLGHELKWLSVAGCALIAAGFGVLVSGGGMH